MSITKTMHNDTEIDHVDVSKLKISDPLEPSSVQDLTKATYRNTLLAWKEKGKEYPSASSMRGNKNIFGFPSQTHSFLKEPVFSNILILLLKSEYLSWTDFISGLYSACHLTKLLWAALVRFRDVSFSDLALDYVHWEKQTQISSTRVNKFLIAALHYDFDLGSVIRFCNGRYTAAYRDKNRTLSRLQEANAPRVQTYI